MSSQPYLSRRTFRVSDLEDRDAIIGFRGGIDRSTGFITWIQPIFRKTYNEELNMSRMIYSGSIPPEDRLAFKAGLN